MKKIITFVVFISCSFAFSQTICNNGFAGIFPCNKIDLMANLTFTQIGGNNNTEGNDCWGWTDPLTNKEYALMGCTTHTAFVDVTNPSNPIYLGKLNSKNNSSSIWRDIKVYNNYAFIVSEAFNHGMQVFDLTKLRNVTTPQNFTTDAQYNGFGSCHNIAINETTGFAYCIGSNTFSGGIHCVNIQNPTNPTLAFGYNQQGYCHDAQIVIYNGPDTQYFGKEIFFGANEDRVVVIDVTNKSNPIFISSFFYSNTAYTHQGWLTQNQKYWILGDEVDELDFGFNTRTVVVDLTDLDNPTFKSDYYGATSAIDHNGYTLNNEFYLANYRAGLRIINTSNLDATGFMNEIASFDTFPTSNSAQYNGAWSVYPYFSSGTIIVSDIDRGLFILKKNAVLNTTTFENKQVTITPNPSQHFVNISFESSIDTIEVFDILGKKVKSFTDVSNNDFQFSVDDLKSGVYIVKINTEFTQKLLKR